MLTPDDLLQTPFLGPWVRTPNLGPRMQHVYASLLHWYEAAKFMPHKPEMRDTLLFQPSLKEAKRFSKLRQAAWRSDWNLVRPSVVIAGLGFLAVQRPELNLRMEDLSAIKEGMAPMKLPDRFVDACLARFADWREGPRIAFIGADQVPEQALGKAVAKLVAASPTWTLVTSSSSKSSWRVHDWCLANFIPVEYLGTPTSKLNKPLQLALADRADHVIVFEERGSKRHDALIAYARREKKRVSLELFSPLNEQHPQIGGLN